MIEYRDEAKGNTAVYLDGKRVGTIKKEGTFFYYLPKGSKVGGERLPSLTAVQRTLRGQ